MALNMNTPARELTNATSTAKVTPDINSINGQNVSQTKDREKYNILKATQVLNQNGAAQFTGTTDISSEALNLLGALGCSLMAPNPGCSYSLLNQQTDEETLTNPNIETPPAFGTAAAATARAGTAAATAGPTTSRRALGTRSINATTSFPNANDPFYEVDPGQSEFTAAEQKNIERMDFGDIATTLAADMAEVNLDDEYDTLLAGFNTSMQ